MIFGSLYVAKWRKEEQLMLREGFLNNTLAELFVTKLLNKIRSSPSKRYETEVLETVEE